MNLLNTAALLWLLLVPALIILYMFRPRRIRKPVSSLRLWKSLPQVERTRARLRRPPFTLLLLLQLLVLAIGAFALTRPALTAPAGSHMVIVVDASGSMHASDGKSRFDLARDEAREVISSMGTQDRATLLRAGSVVSAACTDCIRPDLESALDALQPGAGTADMLGALNLASGLARRQADGAIDTVVISDGEFPPVNTEGLPLSMRFVRVGSAADNRAVAALGARRPPDGRAGYIAFARVENRGASQVTIEVSALADTVPLPKRTQTVPAGGQTSLTWQVPAGTARFTVSISPSDALPADDSAVLFLPSAGRHTVHVVASQPDIYLRALSAIDGLAPVTGTSAAPAAFNIIQGEVTEPLPGGSLLLINPTAAFLPSKGEAVDVRPIVTDPSHPLLSGVDLGALLVSEASTLEPPQWLQTVVDSSGGPLILAGERDGRRIVVLAFDPYRSNITKMVAFPVLMANAVDWLYPLAGTQAIRPGSAVVLAPGSTVSTPSGRTEQVPTSGLFNATDEAGIYSVTPAGAEAPQIRFAVNMADDSGYTGNIGGVGPEHPELNRTLDRTGAAELTNNEFWLPLAAVALALLWGEWIVYCWKRGSM